MSARLSMHLDLLQAADVVAAEYLALRDQSMTVALGTRRSGLAGVPRGLELLAQAMNMRRRFASLGIDLRAHLHRKVDLR